MSKLIELNQLYDSVMQTIKQDKTVWKDICRLAGTLYRYEFDNVLMIYAQKPDARLVAEFDTWKKVERYVKRGSKGIAIFPANVINQKLRYVFDIADTGGKEQKLTWQLNEENLSNYMEMLIQTEHLQSDGERNYHEIKNMIWDFTRTYVRYIIQEEISEKVNELEQIVGNEELPRAIELVECSILYAVGTRMNLDEQVLEVVDNLHNIQEFQDEKAISCIGGIVSDVSCHVLRNIAKNLGKLEQDRELKAKVQEPSGGSRQHGTSKIYGSRRTSISRSREQDSTGGKPGTIWSDGTSLPEGELQEQVQHAKKIWNVEYQDDGSERASLSDGRNPGQILLEKESAEESKIDDGTMEVERTGKDESGRNRNKGNHEYLSLNYDQEEVKKQEASFFSPEKDNTVVQ